MPHLLVKLISANAPATKVPLKTLVKRTTGDF